MAAPRKRKTSARRKRQKDETPGWLWGVFGLAIGLSVAAAVVFESSEVSSHPATSSNAAIVA